MRDWFFFAIWASRLKKLFKGLPRLLQSREKRLAEYKRSSQFLSRLTLTRAKNGNCSGGRLETENSVDCDEEKTALANRLYINRIRQKVAEDLAKNEEQKKKREMFYWGVNIAVRYQEVSFKVFGEQSNHCIEIHLAVFLCIDHRILHTK